MNLASFEQSFSDIILHRGREYFRSGLVTDLEELKPGIWEALVEGTHDYIVEIEIDYDD